MSLFTLRQSRRDDLFIVFEGPDGCGKTTQANLLAESFRAAGREVILTREPGGTEVGERIREILLNPDSQMGDMTELLLIFAARAEHVNKVIWPALMDGKVVICDRFTDSTFAYQVGARQIPFAHFQVLCDMVVTQKPDLVIHLNNPDSQARVDNRGQRDRMEQQGEAFDQRMKAAYSEAAKGFPKVMTETPPLDQQHWHYPPHFDLLEGRRITLNASGDIPTVQRYVAKVMAAYLLYQKKHYVLSENLEALIPSFQVQGFDPQL